MSARAKDEVTEVISEKLLKKYPTPQKLAKANKKDVIKIIKRIGFYNNKSKNVINTAKMLLKNFNGKVPNTLEELIQLPGVGTRVFGIQIPRMSYLHGIVAVFRAVEFQEQGTFRHAPLIHVFIFIPWRIIKLLVCH